MQTVAYKNDNSAFFHFLIEILDPYFTSFSFQEHNFATIIYYILMVVGMIIE